MHSVILCEGGTDAVLIQYFMRVANAWEDAGNCNVTLGFKRARDLCKEGRKLTVGTTEGCSNIIPCLIFCTKSIKHKGKYKLFAKICYNY